MKSAIRRLQSLRCLSTTSPRPLAMDKGGTDVKKTSEGRAQVNGTELHYEMRGNGPHPIVCIPGALGTIESDFRPQVEYFGREGSGFTVVAFDPRGYGQSRPANRFDTGEHFFFTDAKDAHVLMQTLSFTTYVA